MNIEMQRDKQGSARLIAYKEDGSLKGCLCAQKDAHWLIRLYGYEQENTKRGWVRALEDKDNFIKDQASFNLGKDFIFNSL